MIHYIVSDALLSQLQVKKVTLDPLDQLDCLVIVDYLDLKVAKVNVVKLVLPVKTEHVVHRVNLASKVPSALLVLLVNLAAKENQVCGFQQ